VVISEELYDAAFVREQTDLPLLVRSDTHRFLRQSDLKRGGKDDVFYLFDERTQRPVPAPRRTLRLGDLLPALQGEFEVHATDGPVKVASLPAIRSA
jgi:hypothetical protein